MRLPRWVSRWILKLEGWIDRPWVLPCLAALAALDLFVMVIPTDALVISTSMMRPRRWWSNALWLTLGSALGAACLAAATQALGHAFLENDGAWHDLQALIDAHGAWALAAIAVSPLPQQPAVAIAALGEMKIATVFAMIALGRLPKYLLFAFLASHTPGVLLKWGWLREEVQQITPPSPR